MKRDLMLEAREQNKALVDLATERWSKVLEEGGSEFDGWRDDINVHHKMSTTAILLENQLKSMETSAQAGILKGISVPSPELLTEGTETGDVTSFVTQMLAMVRKTYAPSAMFDLFGVQALTSDSAYIFYEKWLYDTNKGQVSAGTQIMRNNTGAGFSLDPFFTSENVDRENVQLGLNTDLSVGQNFTPVLAHTPVKANTLVAKLIDVANGTVTGSVSFDAAGAAVAVTGSGFSSTLGDHSFNSSTSTLTVRVDGNFTGGGLDAHDLVASYRFSLENTESQPLIKITYEKQQVDIQNRLVRFEWTRFAESDTRAKLGIDLAARYQDIGAMQLRSETERQLLAEAFDGAYTTVPFDYSAAFTAGNYDDRNKALYSKVKDLANMIYRLTLRGAANWIVVSTDVASKLDSAMKSTQSSVASSGPGLTFKGVLENGIKVYVDPLNLPQNGTHRCLLGYKGMNPEDAGLFLAPYEPAALTERVTDPKTLNYIQAAYSRYALDFIEDGSHFYVVLEVSNLS